MAMDVVLQKVDIQGHLKITGTDGAYLKLPVLTTTMRDALTAETGMVLFNSTTGQVEDYDGSNWEPLGAGTILGTLTIGADADGYDVKFWGNTSGSYWLWDESADRVVHTTTLTSQTTENIGYNLTYSTDSTYFTGGNITYSGAYTSSVLKIVGTHTNTTGGLHGILIQMNMDEDFTAAAEGILAIKSYLDMNGSAITEGNFIAGAFIAKKSGAGTMATGAILHGIEAWTYCADTSVVGTMIGGNIGYHVDATAGNCSAAGTVWRGLQVFCDNSTLVNIAEETSGIDIWAMAGTIGNALKIGGQPGSFTRGLHFVGGGTVVTGIKFGMTAAGVASDVNCTTGIDMSETSGMTTMLVGDSTLTSQTTENKFLDITFSTDSTWTSGNILWSSSTASTVLKITGTHNNTEGALYGLAVFLTASNNYAADGDGAIAVRGLVTTESSTITHGDIAGGYFVGKKTGTSDAAKEFILYGIEAWAYISGTGVVGTAIGANVGFHADTSADCSQAGSVWRGLQVFCDSLASNPAEETTGIYIWPHSDTIKNALCIGTGAGTFTTGIKFVGSGTTTTGIKFGGQASDTSTSDVTMTTAIDIDEITSLANGISITAVPTASAIVIGASGTPLNMATSGQHLLAVYGTTDRTSGDQMAAYLYYSIGGNGAEGQALRAILNIEDSKTAGGSEEAIYAIVTCNTSGQGTGAVSALRGMMTLPNQVMTAGTYSALVAELSCPTSMACANTPLSFMRMQVSGNGVADFRTSGELFQIIGMGAASSATNIFHTTGTVSATHGLRIEIDGVNYDILLKATTYA